MLYDGHALKSTKLQCEPRVKHEGRGLTTPTNAEGSSQGRGLRQPYQQVRFWG